MRIIKLKTLEEIELIKKSAKLLSQVHGEIAKLVMKGKSTLEMDKMAEEYILDSGGTPSFKNFEGFPYTLCVSPNDVIVHGFPNDLNLNEGDILSIDCGVKLEGYHSDSAFTYAIGEVDEEVKKLLCKTKEALYKGVEVLTTKNRIGDFGYVVQTYVESFGFSVPRELTGHGIGTSLHEAPMVCNYGRRGSGKKIKNGMVLAVEPMVNQGSYKISQDSDGWTVRTTDAMKSAHFEHTVAIVNGTPEILTSFKYIEESYNG